ncbi:MAG TPA: hypothetical protein VFR86_25260 [Burkholderiaceae bacterium]|nr:hypothetical protein [Burkholderiaceae bacterium]
MRYLRTALPQLRSRRTTLGEELGLVHAYLDLFRLRMGARLSFSIDAEPGLDDAEFPPMLLVTLVENALEHGIDPEAAAMSRCTRRQRNLLEVNVWTTASASAPPRAAVRASGSST